jgi:hypothetical protein
MNFREPLGKTPYGFGKSSGELISSQPGTTVPVLVLANIKANRHIRGIDRSEGAESSLHPLGHVMLDAAAYSQGKTAELEKHGRIKELTHTCDDVMRGTALDSSDGGRTDP